MIDLLLSLSLPELLSSIFIRVSDCTELKNTDYWWTYMRADPEGLAEIKRLVGAGKLKIPVEKTFPITEVVAAHEAKEKKEIPGKVVLEL